MVQFTLNGNEFSTLNGGPKYTPNEGVSFIVQCDDQQEIDHFWNSLTADGGEESMCGWLKDKYGVSWQIIPSILGSLMRDPATAAKVGEAFMKMRKFDIAALLDAAK